MTNELNMETFGKPLHLPVEEYHTFVAQHPDFLLVASPEQYQYTWLMHALLEEKKAGHDVSIELVWGTQPMAYTDQVYRVHVGASATTGVPAIAAPVSGF